ncbi:MFS transporter [Bacillus sp. 165]|uniref:MFS transporter n=1 Tax=Bacillus sp. 165 TaxID=1529117 RepID=UPI001ADCE5B9|nr:MFS transporter [Bacillus sp. 165]
MNTSIVRQNERLSIKNGAASTISQSLANNYFSLFAISVLGATNIQVGWLSSLPAVATMLATLPASWLINRVQSKRQFTAISILLTRSLLLLLICIPLLSTKLSSWIFVVLVALMNVPGSFLNVGWQALISELIPDTRRSKFFSNRNRILTIVGMLATLGSGIWMLIFPSKDPLPFQILFGIAFLFGLLEWKYLAQHTENPAHSHSLSYSKPSTKNIYLHRPFLYFLVAALFFNFAWQLAWPLFNIYQIRDAHATAIWISIFTVCNQLAQIVSYGWWGRMADRYSSTRILVIAALGMATAPVLTIVSTNLYYLAAINIFTGVFVSGTVLLLFNSLLESSSPEWKTACIAQYNIWLAGVAFIAPQAGVWMLETWGMDVAMFWDSGLRACAALGFYIMWRKMSSLHLPESKSLQAS